MPANRNALIRFKTLDQCLQNHYRKWTLEDLIEAVSEALYEYEGIDKGVSRRTVQGDIQLMRSDKLGYNAPIIVTEKKYYSYEDREYSITNIPLSEQDLEQLSETVEFLKQFRGFSHFDNLNGMVQKLEDHVYSQKTKQRPIIDVEKNEGLKGLNYLNDLYQSIAQKKCIRLSYQSFKAREAQTMEFSAFVLKEFRNRWFVVGCKHGTEVILTLALDRIVSLEQSAAVYTEHPNFDAEHYFDDVIGVTVSPGMPPETVRLFVHHGSAPYVLTKPFHHSQQVIDRNNYGVTVELTVQLNFELERDILGFGEQIQVIAPLQLKKRIRGRVADTASLYNTELSKDGLDVMARKMEHNGSAMITGVYTMREVNKMRSIIHHFQKQVSKEPKSVYSMRRLLHRHKSEQLKRLLFNASLDRIVTRLDPKAVLTKATFLDKTPENNWYVTWHQDRTISVREQHDVAGYSGWTEKKQGMFDASLLEMRPFISVLPPEEVNQKTFAIRIHLDDITEGNGALKLIPGSHKKVLNDEEVRVIGENSNPTVCTLTAGGVHLLKPLVLHCSSKSTTHKSRRVIHLEFSSATLPEPLEWDELRR
jgi:predicted DNA-binding transcriptional regulator YafY